MMRKQQTPRLTLRSLSLLVLVMVIFCFWGCEYQKKQVTDAFQDSTNQDYLKTNSSERSSIIEMNSHSFPKSLDGIIRVRIIGAGEKTPSSRGQPGRIFTKGEFVIQERIQEPKHWSLVNEEPLILHPDPGEISGKEVYVFISETTNWSMVDVVDK